jgi:hypothetical protein
MLYSIHIISYLSIFPSPARQYIWDHQRYSRQWTQKFVKTYIRLLYDKIELILAFPGLPSLWPSRSFTAQLQFSYFLPAWPWDFYETHTLRTSYIHRSLRFLSGFYLCSSGCEERQLTFLWCHYLDCFVAGACIPP